MIRGLAPLPQLAAGAAGVKERDRVNRRIGKHIQAVARVNERLRDLHDRWQQRREVVWTRP